MQHSVITRLHDIPEAAKNIESYVRDQTLHDYLQSRMLRTAVEREFEIIGEALDHAVRQMPELENRIADVRKIVSFRNLLIHGYAVVENE